VTAQNCCFFPTKFLLFSHSGGGGEVKMSHPTNTNIVYQLRAGLMLFFSYIGSNVGALTSVGQKLRQLVNLRGCLGC
jgi:hypothetical protein